MRSQEELYALPNCLVCHNSRVVPYKDPVLGDRTIECGCCQYRKKINILRKSHIPNAYVQYELGDYQMEAGDDADVWKSNKKSVKKLVGLLKNHKTVVRESVDILLYGGVSVGKTMLGCVMLKEYILQHGYTGKFVTSDELIVLAMNKTRFNFDGLTLDDFLDVDFLMIDNFHTLVNLDDLKIKGMVKVYLSEFFQKRKHEGKSFILTSKLSLAPLMTRRVFVETMAYTLMDIRIGGRRGETKRMERAKMLGLV